MLQDPYDAMVKSSMTVTWYGGSCIYAEERVRGEEARGVLFFPHTKTSRARTLEQRASVIVTDPSAKKVTPSTFRIDMPGEYDVAGFMIRGMAMRTEGSKQGVKSGEGPMAYVLDSRGMTFCYVNGETADTPRERDIEALGSIDILAFPVSSPVAKTAVSWGDFIRAVDPRVVLPLVENTKHRTVITKEFGTDGEHQAKLSLSRKDLSEEGFRITFLDPQ